MPVRNNHPEIILYGNIVPLVPSSATELVRRGYSGQSMTKVKSVGQTPKAHYYDIEGVRGRFSSEDTACSKTTQVRLRSSHPIDAGTTHELCINFSLKETY